MKSKRVLTILLSLAIMLTFMPTMAFAGIPQSADTTGNHTWTVAADKSNLKVIVEPTCTTSGVGIVTCSKGDGCTATHNVVLSPLGHKVKESITVNADEYYAQMLKEGVSKEEMDAWMATYGVGLCTGRVSVCENCGWYLREGTTTLSDPYMFARYASYNHVAPTGLKGCDESFTCEKCGKAGCENNTHYAGKKADYHFATNQSGDFVNCKKNREYDVHGVKGLGHVHVTEYVCKDCGELVAKVPEYVIEKDGATAADFASYHTNETVVVKEATCSEKTGIDGLAIGNGRKVTRCSECGDSAQYSDIPRKEHTWVKKSVAATESARGFEYEQCSGCDAYKDANGNATYTFANAKKVETTPVVEHAVTATVLAPKNCEDNTWILVQCANPFCEADENNEIVSAMKGKTAATGTVAGVEKIGDKYYFKFAGKDIEIPFEEATGHQWGEAETIAEATCEDKALEGRKCSVCGGVYHDTVRETSPALGHAVEEVVVPATCGEGGYSYKICTRCNNYISQDGKDVIPGKNAAALETAKYAKTDPKVKLGEKCKYEWKTLEEATPFKLGTRAKVCTVCENELAATKESIAKTKIAAPKVKAGKKKATVTVKAVPGAVKYQIKVNGKVKVKNAKVGKNVVRKLKGGKKAKFQIVAFNAEGVKATSAAKSVKIKKK